MVKSFKIIFSRTNGPMVPKLGMCHRILEYYQEYINDDLKLALNFLWQGQVWENAITYEFMERFEIKWS